ncbi:hypothetical protein ACUN9W_19350, partial [Escherichia coli]
CPICDSHIKIDDSDFPFEISSEKDLNEELNSLSRRRRNINDMISEMSFKLKKESGYKKELDERLDELRELIDEESQSMITPFLTQRDFYIKEISKNEKVREQLVKDLKVRNQQEELLEKYQVLRKDIEALTERLEALKKNAPSMEGILQGLGDRFSQYLKGINIENMVKSKGRNNFKNLFLYAPQGKADGIKIIPLSEVATKDDFFNIKKASAADLLDAHRIPFQLMGGKPENVGSLGDIEKVAKVFVRNELIPLQDRIREINGWLGQEVIRFKNYSLDTDNG